MKLGIMQPYFFPYLGYYSLIENSDKFILFDTVQYIRHGWINRNRVLKPVDGWQYITVPLEKHNITEVINNIKINTSEDWKGKIIRQLEHYKKKSPYYKQAIDVVDDSLNINTNSLAKLNENILRKTCDYLEMSYHFDVFSEMTINVDPVSHPGEWALNISKALNAKEYLNPPGGVELFDKTKFENNGISLTFLSNNLTKYSQRRSNFEAGLSIIDVMMFNDVETIRKLIQDTMLL